MGGSGYPRGLLRYQIIFEARILAVADVVEAVSSHRYCMNISLQDTSYESWSGVLKRGLAPISATCGEPLLHWSY
jgi:hypothetical protein